MSDDPRDVFSPDAQEGDAAELAPMDARILAAYRGEFGPARRARRRALLAVPLALALVGLSAWAGLGLRARRAVVAKPSPSASPAQALRQDASLVTQTSLAGFEPVEDVEVNVLGGGLP